MHGDTVWVLVGGVAVTVLAAILDLGGHKVDEALVAAITTIVSTIASYLGHKRPEKGAKSGTPV